MLVQTFLWKVPSKAATITILPALAMSSQNSTISGNCRGEGERGGGQGVKGEVNCADNYR